MGVNHRVIQPPRQKRVVKMGPHQRTRCQPELKGTETLGGRNKGCLASGILQVETAIQLSESYPSRKGTHDHEGGSETCTAATHRRPSGRARFPLVSKRESSLVLRARMLLPSTSGAKPPIVSGAGPPH